MNEIIAATESFWNTKAGFLTLYFLGSCVFTLLFCQFLKAGRQKEDRAFMDQLKREADRKAEIHARNSAMPDKDGRFITIRK